jgi:carbamoyl-phosphate synthase large subunit
MHKLLVYPSCNEPGLEISHALLKSNKFTVLGGSSLEPAFDPSRVLLRHHLHCPGFGEPGFAETFSRLLDEHEIDFVFPTVDALVAEFSHWQKDGVIFITPRPELATCLLSKTRTYQRLEGVVPLPQVYQVGAERLPAFAKPDQGSGTRGTLLVETEAELRLARQRGLVVMEHLPGDEHTVDCIGDRSGRLLCAHPRLRGRVGRGISLGTRRAADPRLLEQVEQIAAALRVEGPWFAQFIYNAQGEPRLTEVNGRVGGSMTYTRLCGVNIPLLAAFLFSGEPVNIPPLKTALVLNRALANQVCAEPFDWVIWDLDDTILRKDGKPDPEAMAALYDCHNRNIRQILLSKNPHLETLIDHHQLPRIFVEVCGTSDKLEALPRLFKSHNIDPRRCVMVNDSYSEAAEIQTHFRELRIVMPDALDLLGREQLE